VAVIKTYIGVIFCQIGKYEIPVGVFKHSGFLFILGCIFYTCTHYAMRSQEKGRKKGGGNFLYRSFLFEARALTYSYHHYKSKPGNLLEL